MCGAFGVCSVGLTAGLAWVASRELLAPREAAWRERRCKLDLQGVSSVTRVIIDVTVTGRDLLDIFDVCFWRVWLDYSLRSTVSMKAGELMELVSNSSSSCFRLLFLLLLSL